MIIRNGKEITELRRGNISIIEMYRGKTLIYQAIRSCFGNGYWVSDKPWISSDVWRNN